MIINIDGKQIELTDWQRVTAVTGQKDHYKNWNRRPILNDIQAPYANGVVLVVTYYPDLDIDRFCWTPSFFGEHIKRLGDYYNDFYKDPPTFYDYQIEEAKLHVDKFLLKFNKLIAFI
jgi:hypothetical protein